MILLNLNKPCEVCSDKRWVLMCFTDVNGWELVRCPSCQERFDASSISIQANPTRQRATDTH